MSTYVSPIGFVAFFPAQLLLHPEDVSLLLESLRVLVDSGNTVIVVEHHPLLLAGCDWLIELGPGGGPEGGRCIGSGSPEQLAALETPTAPFLREVLST